MTKARTFTTGLAAGIAAAALLGGVALAAMDAELAGDNTVTAPATPATQGADETANASTDNNAHGMAVSTLATTTTLTGEAKGDAISALASSNAQNGSETHPSSATSASSIATLATTTTAGGRAKGAAISAGAQAQSH